MNPSERIDQLMQDSQTAWQNIRSIRKTSLRPTGDHRGMEVEGSPVWFRDGIIVVANAQR